MKCLPNCKDRCGLAISYIKRFPQLSQRFLHNRVPDKHQMYSAHIVLNPDYVEAPKKGNTPMQCKMYLVQTSVSLKHLKPLSMSIGKTSEQGGSVVVSIFSSWLPEFISPLPSKSAFPSEAWLPSPKPCPRFVFFLLPITTLFGLDLFVADSGGRSGSTTSGPRLVRITLLKKSQPLLSSLSSANSSPTLLISSYSSVTSFLSSTAFSLEYSFSKLRALKVKVKGKLYTHERTSQQS